jgi:hypothetical protein
LPGVDTSGYVARDPHDVAFDAASTVRQALVKEAGVQFDAVTG